MSYSYAPTIHYSFADISGVINDWAETCDQMAVYEHGPDEGQASIHCHILILGSKYKTSQQMKNIFHERIKTTLKGNALWAWEHKDYPNPNIDYLRYCSKGTLAPKFTKNISPAIVEEQRSKWEIKSPDPKRSSTAKKPKEDLFLIVEEAQKIYEEEHKSHITQQRSYKHDGSYIMSTGCNCGPEGHFNQICRIVTRVLKQKRKRFNMFDFERYIYPIWTQQSQNEDIFISALWNKFSKLTL
jgi:hypothetical protein